jgi:hypothetical protein
MLDMVAAHDDELPLPVEVEGVDDPQAGLAAAGGPRDRAQLSAGHPAKHQGEQPQQHEDDDEGGGPDKRLGQGRQG